MSSTNPNQYSATSAPTIGDVQSASRRLAGVITQTPVLTSAALDQLTGAHLFFKCENFQRTGSFKFRGASNAVRLLTGDSAACGVATHSSGNHGAALALAAQLRGIPAHVVVPKGAVESKVANIKRYGGAVTFCEPTQTGRESMLAEVVGKTGASPIPPYDDARIIAGQGTCANELLEQVDDLEVLVAPIGGGGLVSGTALVGKSQSLQVVGVEPRGADDTHRSLQAGRIVTDHHPNTIADGLRGHVGLTNFELIKQLVDDVVLVDDDDTVDAMKLLWSVLKIVVEPSCATVMAAILGYPNLYAGKRVGVILSGGNVDLERLPWSLED